MREGENKNKEKEMKKLLSIVIVIAMISTLIAGTVITGAADEDLVIDISKVEGAKQDYSPHGYGDAYGLMVGYAKTFDLGEYDLSKYKSVSFTYATDLSSQPFEEGMGHIAVIGIKSEPVCYGYANTAFNEQGNIAYVDLEEIVLHEGANWDKGERTSTAVFDTDYNGHIYLSVYNPTGDEVLVTKIVLNSKASSQLDDDPDAAVKNAELVLGAEFAPADINNAIEMRGFTASPDGKYVYGGFLQGGRYVVRFNVSDNSQAGSYKPESSDNELYCKGLAVDDRGYLYVGITHNGQGDITVAAVDKDMKEVGKLVEDLGSKTGINGVAVQKIGEKYYLYAVTAYNVDGVRRYDVTDPTKITLDTTFANNGVMDYSAVTGGAGDPSYIAVDTDGYIYLTYLKTGSGKGSHVGKISADGKSLVKEAEVTQAYGICEAGDYVFAASYNKADSCVKVLKKADLSEVATLKYAAQANNLSDVAFGGNTLFVGDHGNNTTIGGAYYTAAIELEEALPETPEEIVNALYELADNETLPGGPYTLTGVITKVNTAYSERYGNVTVTIVVGDLTDKPVLCYRIKGDGADVIDVGYTVTVKGELVHFVNANNNAYEFKQDSVIVSYEAPAPEIVKSSFNTVWVDGSVKCDVGDALGFLAESPIKGDVQNIGVRGWAWIDNSTIAQFGYKLDNGEPVFSDSFLEDRPDVYAQDGATQATANGYSINPVDVSALEDGEHSIMVLVKAADGSVLEIVTAPFTIDRNAEIPPTDFSDYFGDDHIASEWKTAGGPKVENGVLTLGIPQGNWVGTGYQAYISTDRVNYKAPHVIEFKATVSNFGSCYTGFGLRGADYKDENGNASYANFNNGTRWGRGTESANGIAVDLYVAGSAGLMGLSFEDGTTGGDQPYAIFTNPEGFNVFEEHTYKIEDYGDTIIAYIDGGLFFKIVFSGLADGKYTNAVVTDRNDAVQWTGAVSVNEYGYFGFYQRDAGITISEVTIKGIVDEPLLGDVNGDGSVNNKDVMALFQFVSESLDEGATFIEANADINGDGSVNNKDVKALFDIISSH